MTYDPKQHHRRSIRWFAYDYTEAGAYFVTVCTQRWLCLFGDVSGDGMRLNDAGQMVQDAWDELAAHYPGVHTDAVVVMPNHIHGIILLDPVGAGPRACPDCAGTDHGPGTEGSGNHGGLPLPALALGDVVGRFKSLTTARYIRGVRHGGWPAFAGRLWERNYFEHVIRGEVSLNRIRRYIADNPVNWAHDRDNPDVGPRRPADDGSSVRPYRRS